MNGRTSGTKRTRDKEKKREKKREKVRKTSKKGRIASEKRAHIPTDWPLLKHQIQKLRMIWWWRQFNDVSLWPYKWHSKSLIAAGYVATRTHFHWNFGFVPLYVVCWAELCSAMCSVLVSTKNRRKIKQVSDWSRSVKMKLFFPWYGAVRCGAVALLLLDIKIIRRLERARLYGQS